MGIDSVRSIICCCPDACNIVINTLSLRDALPISEESLQKGGARRFPLRECRRGAPHYDRYEALHGGTPVAGIRSEEHTSELQSRGHLVCRLLLEKKKINLNRIVLQRLQKAICMTG